MSVLEVEKWQVNVLGEPRVNCDFLRLNEGEIGTLEAPSGTGKSLFLRSLVGLESVAPDSYMNHETPWPQRRLRIQLVPQNAVLEEGTVLGALLGHFSWKVRRANWDELKAVEIRIESELSLLGFSHPCDFLKKRAGWISGGERARVALVRSLVMDPALLLLDEPTCALDPATTRRVEQRLMAWVREKPGRGILLVSHDALQCQRLGGRRFVISEGRIQESLFSVPLAPNSGLGDFAQVPVESRT